MKNMKESMNSETDWDDTEFEVSETEILSADYTKAAKLNQHIKIHAQMAQESLYEVCKGLKEMRDDKLYKELGYQNFEEYCEKEVGLKRRQAYNYISVAEHLPEDFVHSGAQIGIKKLALLAKLDEPQREEIQQKVDLDSTTVKELKAKIAELEPKISSLTATNQIYQTENQQLKVQVKERDEELHAAKLMYDELQDERDDLFAENNTLSDELDELRSQGEPVIDAVYSDNSEEVERLTARNEELEKELRDLHGQINGELARVRSETLKEAMKSAAVPDVSHELISLAQIARTATRNLMDCMKDHPGASKYYPDFFRTVLDRFVEIEKEQAEKKV